ncbi:MAG TPA: penicillin-binding protein, partial [Microvirga sp.]|nr:penicillin-binding protein [Microvirga sp.]
MARGRRRPAEEEGKIDDEEPRPVNRAASRRRRSGSLGGRLLYAAVVTGLWAVIAVAGIVAYYASHLPPIDQLAVPKRPPNVAILASDGSLLANRGETGG